MFPLAGILIAAVILFMVKGSAKAAPAPAATTPPIKVGANAVATATTKTPVKAPVKAAPASTSSTPRVGYVKQAPMSGGGNVNTPISGPGAGVLMSSQNGRFDSGYGFDVLPSQVPKK